MLENINIKVLIVCSGNAGYISPFVIEQAESLRKRGVVIDFFLIQGKGIFGYLKNYPKYKKKINAFKPDLIHAHYGLSGMLAVLQRKVPVVTTYHGNDINPIDKIGHSKVEKINLFTFFSLKMSTYNIFVSNELFQISKIKKRASVIPCGVNLEVFYENPMDDSRKTMDLMNDKKYVFFSSSFNNPVKNHSLAKKAIELIPGVILIEMKGYSRKQIALLYSASNILLVTSINESGPLVVKEALACGCPIVATDVGDVKWVIGETQGCFISSFEPEDCADKIKLALDYREKNTKTNGRERIIELGLDIDTIAKKIIELYKNVLKE
jgi:teichuronic acid biosynthesis glycosyltransferase TuaC